MKIFIADSDPVAVARLEEPLSTLEEVSCVTILGYGETNLDCIKQCKPDIIIMDNLLDGVLDLSLLNATNILLPDALKVVYTDLNNKQYLPLCTAYGVDYFVYKNSGVEFLRFLLSDHIRSEELKKELQSKRPSASQNGFVENA